MVSHGGMQTTSDPFAAFARASLSQSSSHALCRTDPRSLSKARSIYLFSLLGLIFGFVLECDS